MLHVKRQGPAPQSSGWIRWRSASQILGVSYSFFALIFAVLLNGLQDSHLHCLLYLSWSSGYGSKYQKGNHLPAHDRSQIAIDTITSAQLYSGVREVGGLQGYPYNKSPVARGVSPSTEAFKYSGPRGHDNMPYSVALPTFLVWLSRHSFKKGVQDARNSWSAGKKYRRRWYA
jgi:hypothetical protein